MGQAAEHSNAGTDREDDALGFLQVATSVFAAGFGVQSRDNKVRDFKRGKARHFIFAGLLFTFGLMAVLIAVVSLVT